MTPAAFKIQNFYDASLCEALDIICRASGYFDVDWSPLSNERSDERRPWLWIDSRSIRREPPNDDGSFQRYLNSKKTNEETLVEAARKARLNDFYQALRPLFLALEEGLVVVGGFKKTGRQQDVQMTLCDARIWAGDWTVTRRADTAEVSFFNEIETEDADATLAAAMLVAPVTPAADKKRSAGRVAGIKQYNDTVHLRELARLRQQGEANTLNAAIAIILRDPARRPAGASDKAIRERMRTKFNELYEVKRAADQSVRVISKLPDNTRTG